MNHSSIIAQTILLGLSTPALAQLSWNPLPTPENIWDATTANWNDGVDPSNVTWENSGNTAAIFPETPQNSSVQIADEGVTVGDLTLSLGLSKVTFTSVTDNLGRLTIRPGGATWDLGGRELEFTNNQANDTPLTIGDSDTLTITGGGVFDTGEKPNGAAWIAEGATLEITTPTVVRGNAASIGQFELVKMIGGSTYVHERNAGQTYSNGWEITGTENLTFTNRWARTINLSGSTLSGTGGLRVANMASTNNGGAGLILSNINNSFEGGIVVEADAPNQATLLVVTNGDSVLGAVPTSFEPDHITLRNGGRIRLANSTGTPMNLNPNRGITLDGGGTIILGGNDNTVNAPITGNGGLQIGVSEDGNANTLHLDAAGSDYTGGTNIVRGTISPGIENGLPNDTILTIGGTQGNAHFDLNGLDQTIGGLTIAGFNTRTVRNLGESPAALIINVAEEESYTYGSNFTGSGQINLTKKGLGTQTLSRLGASYTTSPGDIRITGGTLNLNINTPSGNITVDEDAILGLGHTSTSEPASITADLDSSIVYNWTINDWAGTPSASWSHLDVTGDFIAPPSAVFTIVINENTLENFSESNQTFEIATVGGTLEIAEAAFTIDDTNFTSGTGTWEFSIEGNSLFLSYTAGAFEDYRAYAASFPSLTGGFGEDDDGDGLSNGEEWYFGGSDPTSALSTASTLSQITSTGLGTFTFTHLRPTNTAGVSQNYEWSHTLEPPFNLSGTSDGTFTVTVTPGTPGPELPGYERVTLTVTSEPASATKLFARLKLSLNP